MFIKKEDATGLVILFVMMVIIATFFVLAPNAPEISYRPVEETGSALIVVDPTLDNLGEIHVSATVKTPGFITFHEAIGQAPGGVVGVSEYLQPGEYKDLVITPLRPLERDNQYFALMFKDGGNHKYDLGVDLPIMSNGAVIKVHFITPAM
ncbi:MAG: hypothetical protein WC813_00605 [Patescibacteria group bacterium]|jgi:hypothetical protein